MAKNEVLLYDAGQVSKLDLDPALEAKMNDILDRFPGRSVKLERSKIVVRLNGEEVPENQNPPVNPGDRIGVTPRDIAGA